MTVCWQEERWINKTEWNFFVIQAWKFDTENLLRMFYGDLLFIDNKLPYVEKSKYLNLHCGTKMCVCLGSFYEDKCGISRFTNSA